MAIAMIRQETHLPMEGHPISVRAKPTQRTSKASSALPAPLPVPKPTGGWLVYARCSTDDQAKGATIDAQVEACTAWLSAYGLPLRAIIRDAGFSGSNMSRPGIQQVMALVKEGGVEGVVAVKIDRLSRKLQDMMSFYDHLLAHKTKLACVRDHLDTSTASGRAFFQFRTSFAEMEHGIISERQRASHAHHRAHGLYAGGVIPAGMIRTGTRGNYRLEVDPVWGPILAKSWDMILLGKSYRDIIEYLEAQRMPHRSGKPWSIQSLWSMFHRGWARGTIVSPEVFDLVKRRLAQRWSPTRSKAGPRREDEAPSPSGNSERVWLLQGIAHCVYCGAAMTGTHGNGNGGRFFYLRCSARSRRGAGSCQARNLSADTWEKKVINAFRKSLDDDQGIPHSYAIFARERQEAVAGVKERHRVVVEEQGKLQAALDRLIGMVSQGDLVARALGPSIAQHQEQIDALVLERRSLEAALDEALASQRGVEEVLAYLRGGLAAMEEALPDERKRILRGLLQRVTMGLGEEGPHPMRLRVKIPIQLPGSGSLTDSSNAESPAEPRKRVEPAACAAGSTGRSLWCPGKDSNLHVFKGH
jgi:site-specific DNA recombinase